MKKSPVTFIRAGAFGIIIVLFFLPFVVVSCPNMEKSVSVTGLQLSTGTVIRGSDFGPHVENRRLPLHWQALAALLCAVAGVVVSFLPKKASFFLCLAAGAGGIVCMFLLRNQISREGAEWVRQGFRLYYASGFWTTITFFAVALVVTLITNPYIKWNPPGVRKKGRRR